MWFFLLLGFAGIIWMLWVIARNTGEALDYQQSIQKELQQLNQHLTEQNLKQQKTVQQKVAQQEIVSIAAKALSSEAVTLVSINEADIVALQTLPGVGKALALKIIEARSFESVDALTRVSGISEEFLKKLKPYIEL